MSKEIALDLRRYDSPFKLSSLIQDTASLAIEASDSEIPRVNPHYFVKTREGKIIAPGKDKREVTEMFATSNLETLAGNEIIRRLKEDTDDFAYVWISPSDPYPESRIEIGAKKTTKSGKFEYIKAYGISTLLSGQDCLKLGQLLVSMSPEDVEFPSSPEQLRSQIIKLAVPEGIDPFYFLSQIIDLPEKDRFQSILDGTADKNKLRALRAAGKVTKPVRENPEIIFDYPIAAGAQIEIAMRQNGFGMDPHRFGCGISNLFASSNENGIVLGGEYCEECPICHRRIQAVICIGYQCKGCGGIKLC